jgi:hypothetical protein
MFRLLPRDENFFDLRESVTDRCDDVLNVIEGITLKMA